MSGINLQVALRRAERAIGSAFVGGSTAFIGYPPPPCFSPKSSKTRHLGADLNCKIFKTKGLIFKIFKTNDLGGVFVPRGHNPEARGFCLFYVYYTGCVKGLQTSRIIPRSLRSLRWKRIELTRNRSVCS